MVEVKTKLDQFARDYNEIYEFLVTLSDKADTISCNCDGDFDGEAWIYTQCHLHKAKELLEELEK